MEDELERELSGPDAAGTTDKPTAIEGVVDLPPLFSIAWPDEDDQVWLCDEGGNRRKLLSRTANVAEILCQWLGSIDHGECP